MAASGYTPIILFNSGTTGHTPTTGNLAVGELAINYTDGKLYYNTGSAIAILANAASQTPVTTFSAGTTGFTPSTATSGAVTLAGTLATTNGGTGLTSFTANGVVYASSTSALATGSALQFDGTNLTTTGSGFSNDVGGSQGIFRVTSSNNTANNVLATFASPGSANNQLNIISAASGVIGLQSHLWSTGGASYLSLNPNGGNVGIGTNSPNATLNVYGGNAIIENTTSAYVRVQEDSTGNNNRAVLLANSTGMNLIADYNATAIPMIFNTANAERMRLTTAGYLGIGTSSPDRALNVVGASPEIRISTDKTTSGALDLGANSTACYINANYYGSPVPLVFQVPVGTEAMRLTTSGYLGIGTSSPDSLLTVGSSGTRGVTHVIGTSSQAPLIQIDNTNASGGHTWGIYAGSTSAATFDIVDFTVGGGTTRLTVDGSGNLGLGVNPSAWGSDYIALQYKNKAAIANYTGNDGIELLSNAYAYADNSFKYLEGYVAARYSVGGGYHSWYVAPSGTAGNAITFTQAMTLDTGGRLLIGQTSNNGYGLLQVNGNIVSGTKSTTTGSVITFNQTNDAFLSMGSSSDGSYHYINSNYDTSAGVKPLRFVMAGNYSSTPAMTITAANNVGIGTSSPAYLLDVGATGNSNAININGTASFLRLAGSSYGQIASTTTLYLDAGSSLPVVFRPNGSTEAGRFDSSGNLLLGTTSANGKLTIGSTAVGNNTIFESIINGGGSIVFGVENSSGGTLASGSSGYAAILNQQTNYSLQFATNNAVRATIDNSGNLLVGYTSSAQGIIGAYQTANAQTLYARCTNTSLTQSVVEIEADRNTTNNTFYAITYLNNGSGTYKFRVADSGNVTNTNNSYGAISDVKLKDNIVDATPKLADLLKVQVRNYNLKTDPSHKQLGVVAQELEQVFPSMIDESPDKDKDGNDLGTTTKSVKYSVFVPMLIKAIQELNTLVTTQSAEIAALKQKVGI